MTEAAEAAGVTTLVGFGFLKNPVQQFARELIAAGEIGEIIQFRGAFDQDALLDPAVPFSWRFEKAVAGSGALGDLGSHIISLAQMLVGDFEEILGMTGIFIKERPVATGGTGYTASAGGADAMRAVENDDVTQFLGRVANGAIGTLGTSRIGAGRKIGLAYEIQGTKGALLFSQERMNEIKIYRHTDPSAERGFKTVFNSPEHPGYSGFFPIAGIPIGYNDLKIIEARDLLMAVSAGQQAYPDFRFGYQVDRVVDAVLESASQRRWVSLSEIT
jgi:predicted dehydrogenase